MQSAIDALSIGIDSCVQESTGFVGYLCHAGVALGFFGDHGGAEPEGVDDVHVRRKLFRDVDPCSIVGVKGC